MTGKMGSNQLQLRKEFFGVDIRKNFPVFSNWKRHPVLSYKIYLSESLFIKQQVKQVPARNDVRLFILL